MADFTRIKEQLISEINVRSMNDTKVFNFTLKLFKDNIKLTTKFLLSEGYTQGQINRVLSKKASKRYLNISL